MSNPLFEKIYVTAIGALFLTASLLAYVGNVTDSGGDNGVIIQSGSYEGMPSTDPDDGKFVLIAGSGHVTIAGTEVVAYIGIPANESTFEVGIFDGDVGGHWDFTGPSPTSFTLYMDRLKNGTTASPVRTWSSSVCPDDDWHTETFTVSPGARAPSGNYFYRLVVEWQGGTPSSGLNDFKIRTTGQVNLATGHEFGFAGGPQNLSYDPDFGPENTYDGHWCYNFYIPVEMSRVVFRDGDADIIYDTDDPNTPPPEGDFDGVPPDDNYLPWGDQVRVSPNVYVVVTDPDSNAYYNSNPSGNEEWELFTIGDLPDDDHVVNYTLSPGLWKYEVKGMDAHNANFLETTYEIFVCGATPPLPVNPPPEVEPDRSDEVPGGATYYYSHTITNKGVAQAYNLKTTSSLWTSRVYEDSNANGIYDVGEPEISETPDLNTNETYYVLVAIDVPSGPPGTTDTIKLTASSRIEWGVQDSAYDEVKIRVEQPPVPNAGGPYLASEGDIVHFDASGTYDPNADPLQYMWDVDDDGIFETSYSSSPSYDFIFGDDFIGRARLRVTDGTYEVEALANVTIENVAPSLTAFYQGYSLVDVTFRIAGEKWHDVQFYLFEDGTEIAYAQIVRYPGSPNDQAVTIPGVNISMGTEYSVLALYTPMDDPINGQIWGSDPAWVILDFHDGNETWIHHTFNVRHNDTWTWEIERLNEYFAGHDFPFEASASDPGSDDLTFIWDWGDGSSESRIYYNNGMSPDPYPSLDVNPISIVDATNHAYAAAGDYLITVEVLDDDGGSSIVTFTVHI
ncbi:MAG: PKD domain-containing protein [Thermoplasmata archaeon]